MLLVHNNMNISKNMTKRLLALSDKLISKALRQEGTGLYSMHACVSMTSKNKILAFGTPEKGCSVPCCAETQCLQEDRRLQG